MAFANNVDISNNDFIGDDQTATFVEDFGPAVEQGEQLDLDAILNNQGNTFDPAGVVDGTQIVPEE